MARPMTIVRVRFVLSMGMLLFGAAAASAQESRISPTAHGDQLLADYFRAETGRLQQACLAEIQSIDDWTERRAEYRRHERQRRKSRRGHVYFL